MIYHLAYVLAVFLVIGVVFCSQAPRNPAKAMQEAQDANPCPGGVATPSESNPGYWLCGDSMPKFEK